MKCKYCGEECKSESQFKSGHLKFCTEYRKILDQLTKEKLYELYIEKQMSAIDIQKMYGLCSWGTVYNRLKKYGINKDWTDVALQCADKRKATNLKLTGHEHNFCKNHPSRKEWEKKLLEEEGITNVFQRQEVKDKIVETIVQKYKTESPVKYHTRVRAGRSAYTSIHRKIVELLQSNEINVQIELKIKKSKKFNKRGGFYSYDILCLKNKIIEIQGDYWHGNPKKYKPDDIILKGHPRNEKTVAEKWKEDKIKADFARENGYEVLVLWEDDINNNMDLVCKTLSEYLGVEIKNDNSKSNRL